MNLQEWKDAAGKRLQESARSIANMAPGMAYGALSASTILPVVAAVGQGDFAVLATLGSVVGGVGGDLIAGQIQAWQDQDEDQLAAELSERAADDPAWRDALDALLLEFEAPRVVQAVLPEADWDRFQGLLREELAKLGNLEKYDRYIDTGGGAYFEGQVSVKDGDVVGRDKIEGDQVAGDKVEGDKHEYHRYEAPTDPAETASTRAEERYLRRLFLRCNSLPLSPLGGEESSGEEVTLGDVYVALDTTARRRLTPAERKELKDRGRRVNEDAEKPIPVLEVTGQTRRLVLLGDPGSGKSTFVRQLCAWQTQVLLEERGPLPGLSADLLPLFTVIREVAPKLAGVDRDGLSPDMQKERLAQVLWEHWRTELGERGAAFADDLLDRVETGQALVVFDGLDEVPGGQRRLVRQAIAGLLQACPRIQRVIVTCRVRSYTEQEQLAGFETQTLAPFDQEKIRTFVQAWYGSQARLGRMNRETAQARQSDLQTAALSSDLRDLSSNPMLLTTMAIVHQKETQLPRERVRLYALAVQVLVQRWQTHRGLAVAPGLQALFADDLRLRAVLERLAFEAHSRAGTEAADLPRSELLTLLEREEFLGSAGLASAFLDYVDHRAGLLVGQGGDERERPQSYAFPHRTFQEYLAGCYLVGGRGISRTYWRLAGESETWALAGLLGAEELLYNRRNRNELLDLMYDLCPATEPEEQGQPEQAWRATVWSGQMAALLGPGAIERDEDRPDGGRSYLARLRQRLVRLLHEGPLGPVERADGGSALGQMGDPRPGVGILEMAQVGAQGLAPVQFPAIDWVKIPETDENGNAEFIYQDGEKRTEPTFWMARYPITYAQFQTFIDAEDGWDEPEWWKSLDVSVQQRQMPFEQTWKIANHPREMVSWYQAVAFCRWLTAQAQEHRELLPAALQNREKWRITLPTEWQWEKAARGWDGRQYPWGEEYISGYANINETRTEIGPHNLQQTTAVGMYPQGASPFGVQDLSGNVWEWCLNEHGNPERTQEAGRATRVLRGGSWYNLHDYAAAGFRGNDRPSGRDDSFGFRVVVVL